MKKKNRTIGAFAIASLAVGIAFILSIIIIIASKGNSEETVSDNESVVSDNDVILNQNTNDNIDGVENNNSDNSSDATKLEAIEQENSKPAFDRDRSIIIRNAYASALAKVCEGGFWPDDQTKTKQSYLGFGNKYGKCKTEKDIQNANHFTVIDIDNDGTEELVVEINNADAADRITVIYQYDTESGNYYREASFYTGAVFYDNYIVFDEWSHNPGNGNFIWPYSVYKYDRAQDTYNFIAQVDSWNKKLCKEDFPDTIDRDGDGNIVIITAASETLYLDNSEYYQWIVGVTEGSEQKNIDYQVICPDNYAVYSIDYIDYRISEALKLGKIVIEGNDIGTSYALNDDSVNEVLALLTEEYSLEFKKSKDKKYSKLAKADDEAVFALSKADSNKIVYFKEYEDITVFGIRPGMKLKEAESNLFAFGFGTLGEGIYKLGADGRYIEICVVTENDSIVEVSLSWRSDY